MADAPAVVLLHGAATSSRVWRRVRPFLHGVEVLAPDRGMSGSMDAEMEQLIPLCTDAVVVGVSGGATLALEMAARGMSFQAALLHEPAAGSVAPGLLTHVARGLEEDGVTGFGAALYGPSWSPAETSADRAAVSAEFSMFGAFEPRPLERLADRILLSYGSCSPAARRQSVEALSSYVGVRHRVIDGASHAAHLEAPRSFADAILDLSPLRNSRLGAPIQGLVGKPT